MAGATALRAGRVASPAVALERAAGRSLRRQANRAAPASLSRPNLKLRDAPKRLCVRAQGDSRDASKPGSTPPGGIKRTVQQETGVSTGKSTPGGSKSTPGGSDSRSDSQTHAKNAEPLRHDDPNSFAARQLNSKVGADTVSDSQHHWQAANEAGVPTSFGQFGSEKSKDINKKVSEVSDAVPDSMSYAQVADRLRKEDRPMPGPIRSEVMDRAVPKEQPQSQRQEKSQQKEDRPFKEPQQEGQLDLEPAKRSFNFKAIAAIAAILVIAFALAPVWSPVVGSVLTPIFQLVGVAVAVKFFITDFLRGDKRKELYKKGEQFKKDVTG